MAQKKKKKNRSARPCPTSGEAAILRAIWQLCALQHRTPTIAEIQRELRGGQRYDAVGNLVRRMERKGYVKRSSGTWANRVGIRAVWDLDRCLRAAVLQVVDDYQTTCMMVADIAANQ